MKSLEAIYYPSSRVKNINSFASYCLFFDKLHLIHLSDISFGDEDPTTYLKNLPDKFSIRSFGKDQGLNIIEEYANYFRFVKSIKPLLGDIVFYHKHFISSTVSNVVNSLLKGTLKEDELYDLLLGKTQGLQEYEKYKQSIPHIAGTISERTVPSALYLSKKNDWVLVSDDTSMPIPQYSRNNIGVRELSAILAEECISIALPSCSNYNYEDILEIREKYKDLLIPFRMGLQKLSGQLRNQITDNSLISDIKNEARFITESQIEPALYELNQIIQRSDDKLITRVFGKFISWIPFVAKAFVTPTPESIYNSMIKVYSDVGEIADAFHENRIKREPGLSYLLAINNQLKNNKI